MAPSRDEERPPAPRLERQAYPDNILQSDAKPRQRLTWVVLSAKVFHPNKRRPGAYTGFVKCTYSELANEMGCQGRYKDKTARRGVEDLRKAGRLCLPRGDSPGRSGEMVFHLHAPGEICRLPSVHLKQRENTLANDNRTAANQRRNHQQSPGKVDNLSTVSDKESTFYQERWTKSAERVDKNVIAYKEDSLNSLAAAIRGTAMDDEGRSNIAAAEDSKLTPDDIRELRRIEQGRFQIDGLAGRSMKADLIRAGFSLAHLRWHLNGEEFASARDPVAVVRSMARNFQQIAETLQFPVDLDGDPQKVKGKAPIL